MKTFFAISALVCLAMYLGAVVTSQTPTDPNVVRLRWVTDTNPARKAQLELFNRLDSKIQVFIDPNTTGDPSKLIVQCATGVGPDIMDLDAPRLQMMVSAGVLLDLTPYAESMGFGVDQTFPAIQNDLMVDGRQYAFPCNVSSNAVIFNKAIFDDHGVPYPRADWTYDDFSKACQAIINNPSKSGKTHMAVANVGGFSMFMDLFAGRGGRLFTPNGRRSALNSEAAIGAAQQYSDFLYCDKIIPTPTEIAAMSSQGGFWSGTINLFSSGQSAMMFLGRFYIVQVPNSPDLKGELGSVTVPHQGKMPSRTFCGARSAAINVKSPHRLAALKFLQFLASNTYSQAIIEDGDGLPPSPAVATSGEAMVNSMVGDASFHQAFLDSMKQATSLDTSPYIDTAEMLRWLQETIDKIENRLVKPDVAFKALSDQVDRRIAENIQRRG